MPPLQFPPYALIVFTSAAVTFSLGAYALYKRSNIVYIYLGISFITVSLWPLSYGIELLIADPEISIIFAYLRSRRGGSGLQISNF